MPPSTDAEILGLLLERIARELPRAVALRRRLHAAPELAHAEEHTAASVAAELPVPCQTAAGTGRLALVAASSARAPIAVRAELDGLPIEERTGAAFTARGGAMHACGHDVHMAALVALARAAHGTWRRTASAAAGNLPAERGGIPIRCSRALASGELTAIAPAAIVAAHIHPELPWGAVGLDSGAVNASCDAIEITVEGEPTHGAYPHRGRDPILAIAQVVVALHAEVGRRIDPLSAASLTIGVLEGGSAENVIPRAAPRARRAARAPPAGSTSAA